MARATGNKKPPKQPTQRQSIPAPVRQQQPTIIVQAQQQQPNTQPGSQQPQPQTQQWSTSAGPQQIQMPPRLQQPQTSIRQKHPINVIQQQQQLSFIPQQLHQPQQPSRVIQQQLQQVPTQIGPQVIHLGPKRHAQEPVYVLSEQALRDPLIKALERNINKNLISHTLHRTFGVAKIF